MKTKPRTAVLLGGNSSEREISRLSGMAVCEALRGRGYDVTPIDVRDDFLKLLADCKAEVAFLALHGAFGEDGQIQAILEDLGLPYTGSGADASRLGMDKPATKRVLEQHNVPTPKFNIADNISDAAATAEKLGYPLVVKPAADGSSFGVSIIHEPESLPDAFNRAAEHGRVMLEAYIHGRELTVGIINGKALPIIEILCDGFFDFTSKYTKGRTSYIVGPDLPPDVAEAITRAGVQTYECVGCAGAARVDIRLDAANTPYVLEINTIPGLTATSLVPKAAQAVGISFDELCEMMITDAIARCSLKNTGGTLGEKKATA